MIIRFAKKEDVPQILSLCKAHAEYEQAAYDSAGKLDLLSKYLFQPTEVVKCLVVEKDNRLVGYASFMKQFSTWDAEFYIYMDCLYLNTEVRGKGIGSQLMEQIKNYAQKEGCKTIQWQTPDFNKKAILFYKKIGAISKTKERFYLQ